MSWPSWIDELRARYLADEGNLFLLHGAIDATWPVDGEELGAVDVLARFLGRTRQVIGVVRSTGPITFPHFEDAGRFERLLSARELVLGDRLRRDVDAPEAHLGLAWAALNATGFDQAWILPDAHVIFPGHRKRVEPLGSGAPPLDRWAGPLKATNHLVVLLAPTRESVRREIADAAVVVAVPAPIGERSTARGRVGPVAEPVADDVVSFDETSRAEAEIEAFLAGERPASLDAADEIAPADDASPAGPSAEDLAEALTAELQRTIPAYPVASWSARLPVMDAVARVLAGQGLPFGDLTFAQDADGAATVHGPAADLFLARWRGDIALDASAGMLLKEIPVPDGADRVTAPVPLHETAIRALSRRMLKLLA